MAERENMGEGNQLWANNGNEIGVQFGFESCLNPKTASQLFSNFPWDPHKIQVRISDFT